MRGQSIFVSAAKPAYDASLRAVNQFCQTYRLRYYLNRRRLADVVVLFIVGATLLLGFLVGYTSELRARHFVVMAALFVLFVTATVYLIWEVDRPETASSRPVGRCCTICMIGWGNSHGEGGVAASSPP
jgi:hypothetical protein